MLMNASHASARLTIIVVDKIPIPKFGSGLRPSDCSSVFPAHGQSVHQCAADRVS